MSMIGARKKREKNEWVMLKLPGIEEREPEPIEYETYTEEDSKLACELVLLFMLMHVDRHAEGGRWYKLCVEAASGLPSGSYRNVFLWGMRDLRSKNTTLDGFRSYVEWKINEYDVGHIRRDGPRW